MLAVRLPADIETRLEELSKKTHRAKSFYIRQALIEYLDDMEDLYLAEQELQAVRAGQSKSIPLEEVMKEYGMEG